MNEVYRCPHSVECKSKLKEDELNEDEICYIWYDKEINFSSIRWVIYIEVIENSDSKFREYYE